MHGASGGVIVLAMPETRSPETMPTEWTVATFAHEQGFGTLRHATGEEVVFDYGTWDVGDWKSSPKDIGAALPRPGEPVRVAWKRSASGKNTPRLVQPIGRVSLQRHDLSSSSRASDSRRRFVVSPVKRPVCSCTAFNHEDLAAEWREKRKRDASDFADFLMSIAHLAADDPTWGAAHADWIYADDHRWDRDRARATLPAMLGLAPGSVETGVPEESLSEYAAACNVAAASAGLDRRLHEIARDDDEHVFVCLLPSAFDVLARGGYLAKAP